MAPKVISLDLYSRAAGGYMSAQAHDFATAAGAHRDVSGQWMGRAATLPETNAGAAVDAAAGQAQRQAVAHQNEADALDATANYHRRAADLGQQMNAQLDRLDQRAQRLIEGSPATWHPRIRALAQAAGEALNSLYAVTLWGPQESAGAVIEPLHQGIIRGLGGTGGAAPGKASPKLGEESGPRSAAASSPPTGPNLGQVSPGTATASAAAPAAASQPERPDLVPVMVGLPVGGGAPEDAQPPAIKPDDSDDDDLGGGDPPDDGGTIASVPAGGGAGGKGVADPPHLSQASDQQKAVVADPPQAIDKARDQVEAGGEPAATPLESTPAAAAPAAADRRQRRRPQNGNSPMKGQQ